MLNMGIPEVFFSIIGMLVPLVVVVWIVSSLVGIRRALERIAARLDAMDTSLTRS
jgi:hypothetical protein